MDFTVRVPKTILFALIPALIAAIVAIGFFPWSASAGPTTPDTNINSYALFALHDISMKGGTVHGGNVGVNNVGGDISVCANDNFTMDAGTQFVSDNALLNSGCKLDTVFVNGVSGSGFTPMSPPIQSWTPPLLTLPPLVRRSSWGWRWRRTGGWRKGARCGLNCSPLPPRTLGGARKSRSGWRVSMASSPNSRPPPRRSDD